MQPSGRITRAVASIFKSNPRYVSATSMSNVPIPRSPKAAIAIPEWKNAMAQEFKALIDNKTWCLIARRKEDIVVNTRWIFRIKYKEDGTIDRYKARLVANGFRQVELVDYIETFSPILDLFQSI